jgi:hypothetical protein
MAAITRETRYRNFGTVNDRLTIKARQSLSFKDWFSNVQHNQMVAKQRSHSITKNKDIEMEVTEEI